MPTLFLGRFFCGWICPMGTLQHFVGNMPSESKRGKQRIESNRYKRWQTVKYVVLIAGLVAAAFGSMAIGWLDPFSLLVRSIGLSLLPAFNFVVRAVLTPMETSHVAAIKATGGDHPCGAGSVPARISAGAFYAGAFPGSSVLRDSRHEPADHALLVPRHLPTRRAAGRTVAMVGARPHKDPEACNNCNRCLLDCQGGDDPIGSAPWRKSECLMCMNCVGSCPDHALRFRFFRPNPKEVASPDLGRRRTLTGLAAGAVAVPLMRANTGLGKSRNERLLRPPGALDETDFLGALHPLRGMHESLPQQCAATRAY